MGKMLSKCQIPSVAVFQNIFGFKEDQDFLNYSFDNDHRRTAHATQFVLDITETSLLCRLQAQTLPRWSSTNRPNPPIQLNGRNFWTIDGICMPFGI